MYRLSKTLIEVCGLKSHANRSFFLVFIKWKSSRGNVQ